MPGKLVEREYGNQTWSVSLDVIRNPPGGSWKRRPDQEPQPKALSDASTTGSVDAGLRIALVGGVHSSADAKHWALVGRDGGPTRDLKNARMHDFTTDGKKAALEAGRLLEKEPHPGWTVFVARVCVKGEWEKPFEVTPTWVKGGLYAPTFVTYDLDEGAAREK